jgi:phospholipase/carboxylesterase
MNLLYTAQVPAGDGPFPAVLALHGWGASGHDLLGIARFLHDGDVLMLAPQGPIELPTGPGMTGFGWFPLARGGPLDLAAALAAADQVESFLDAALARYPIDPNKLVVLGFSQGGVVAYELFLRSPKRFAAGVALSSWLPSALADAIPQHSDAAGRPLLILHGTRDSMIPVERARESRSLLLARRLAVTYREYEMGHEIAPDALRELVEWLDAKVFAPSQIL